MDFKSALKKTWHFIWNDDSIWSWLVNIVLAFVLIKFIVYPGLGFVLSTSHPIVAVVSGSMQHNGENFDSWWENGGSWYIGQNMTEEEFRDFKLHNGFNKGDIIVLKGKKPADLQIGDIIVFNAGRSEPVIHRIARKWQENGIYYFRTKGDNYRTNIGSFPFEMRIQQDKVIGSALVKIPLLGYVKILFVKLICLFGKFNFCIV